MKPNAAWRAYYTDLIREIKKRDKEKLVDIRAHIAEVNTQVDYSVFRIGKDATISRTDIFDYNKLDRITRGHFSKIQTVANTKYEDIGKVVVGFQREVFLLYRDRLKSASKKIGLRPVTEKIAEAMTVGFGGTPSAALKGLVKDQLKSGFEPASLIKTVSQDHVKQIQVQMLDAIQRGKGFGWGSDRVLKSMWNQSASGAIDKGMEYKVTRIMRTSYMKGVNNDQTNFVKSNQELFYGSRRTADGDPCIECIVLDGDFYEPGEEMDDHPNGQCMLVPLMYPDEYFTTGQITQNPEDSFGPTLLDNLYAASEEEQRAMFGNDKLFNLWKNEKIDLSKLKTGIFDTPMSGRQAYLNIETLGGKSYTAGKFESDAVEKSLNGVMDPKDRSVTATLQRESPRSFINGYGLDTVGKGDGYLLAEKIPAEIKARILALYDDGSKLGWIQFNERSRLLGLYTRKDINGRLYYVVNKNLRLPMSPTKTVKAISKIPNTWRNKAGEINESGKITTSQVQALYKSDTRLRVKETLNIAPTPVDKISVEPFTTDTKWVAYFDKRGNRIVINSNGAIVNDGDALQHIMNHEVVHSIRGASQSEFMWVDTASGDYLSGMGMSGKDALSLVEGFTEFCADIVSYAASDDLETLASIVSMKFYEQETKIMSKFIFTVSGGDEKLAGKMITAMLKSKSSNQLTDAMYKTFVKAHTNISLSDFKLGLNEFYRNKLFNVEKYWKVDPLGPKGKAPDLIVWVKKIADGMGK